MDCALKLYKKLIDDLANQEMLNSVTAKRVREKWLWLETAADELTRQNKIIESLSDEDREIVSDMLESERAGGIHDVLVYLEDQMCLGGLRISIDGIELPLNPFWSMYHDWQYRRTGEKWPDENGA
jgi:hypothetical protein